MISTSSEQFIFTTNMFVGVETYENQQRMCSTVPEKWVHDNILTYPDKVNFRKYRKKNVSPQEGWAQMPCKIISRSFGKCC